MCSNIAPNSIPVRTYGDGRASSNSDVSLSVALSPHIRCVSCAGSGFDGGFLERLSNAEERNRADLARLVAEKEARRRSYTPLSSQVRFAHVYWTTIISVAVDFPMRI